MSCDDGDFKVRSGDGLISQEKADTQNVVCLCITDSDDLGSQQPLLYHLSKQTLEAMVREYLIGTGVGKLKDEVVYTLAWRLTEVAAMADVLRFATLLSLIFVGVLSLPAQRRTDSDDCGSAATVASFVEG
ncbi:hypothetical protein Tco_1120086 [Tanacetum coccineum]